MVYIHFKSGEEKKKKGKKINQKQSRKKIKTNIEKLRQIEDIK